MEHQHPAPQLGSNGSPLSSAASDREGGETLPPAGVAGLTDDVRNLKFDQPTRSSLAADRTDVQWRRGPKGGSKVVNGANVADRRFGSVPMVGYFYFPNGTLTKIVWLCQARPKNPPPAKADRVIREFMDSLIATFGDPDATTNIEDDGSRVWTMSWTIDGVKCKATASREASELGFRLDMVAQPHPGNLFEPL